MQHDDQRQPSQKEAAEITGWQNWIEYRIPFFKFARDHLVNYKTPKNLNYLWNMGSLAGITLVIMILSGIFLAAEYVPHTDHAFASVERIMREVNGGWIIRYLHMNGASMFFIVIYIHIFRGLYYGSFKAPRELVWLIGVVIFVMMMATAFMGYVLPWGQMSFWGATVITNLFSAIPVFGQSIVEFLWGGYSIDNPTLNRFFVLHYLIPFLIVGLVIVHLITLHVHGSNNPTGVDKKVPKDTVPFHPYYTIKDMFGLGIFALIWATIIFFMPNLFGEPDNYIPANPLVTPPHIVPEWYFLPFYAILRCVPDKGLGVILMFSAVLILAIVPWLDRSPIRSSRFRPVYRYFMWFLVITCFVLGWSGSQMPEGLPLIISRFATMYYFAHFLIVMPLCTKFERGLTLPATIDEYEQIHNKAKDV